MTAAAIILMVFGVIVAGGLAASLVPLMFSVEINASSDGQKNGSVNMHWLHPWLAQWKYDVERRHSELTLFGLTSVFTDKSTPEMETGEAPVSKREHPVPAAVFKTPETGAVSHKEPPVTEHRRETYEPDGAVSGEKPAGPSVSGWKKAKKFFLIMNNSSNQRAAVKALRWCRITFRLCFSMVSFNHCRIHTKAGAGYPAETGKIFGYYTALDSGCFSLHKNLDVRFTPEFSDDSFECEGSIALRTNFARVLLPLLWAFVTFPYLTAYFVWRRIREKKF